MGRMDTSGSIFLGIVSVLIVGVLLLVVAGSRNEERRREERRKTSRTETRSGPDAGKGEVKSTQRKMQEAGEEEGVPTERLSTLVIPPPDEARIEGVSPRNDSFTPRRF